MILDINGNALSNAYGIEGIAVNRAYDIEGEIVFPDSIDYDSYTLQTWLTVSLGNMQGFAIYDKYIFQFRATLSGMENVMCTINTDTASIIQNNIQAMSGHGGSASFSNEHYEQTDQFPLLYVSAQSVPCNVYVNRVTTTSSTLVKTLVFPLESSGYYADHVYDLANHIMYTCGYTAESFTSGTNNEVRISAWDMTNLTDNGDGSYTPALIRTFTRPFIYVMQGKAYHDGMIWICSGYYGSSQSYIYAISPVDGTLLHTIDLDTTTEVEGLQFISPNEAIVGLAGAIYRKCTFAINN